MKVTLIDYTGMGNPDPDYAINLLIFTKSTRLNMTAGNLEVIAAMPRSEKLEQLNYMANTIKSSWEHIHYQFSVEGVSRACANQMVRTRNANYSQQSLRVTEMADFEYRTPPNMTTLQKTQLEEDMAEVNKRYKALLASGASAEDARSILPLNILTNIICGYNLRTMASLVASRSGGRTQDEYREVMQIMGEKILSANPWADVFLYPKGLDYFTALEETVSKVSDWKTRTDILKVIDKMRAA